MIDPKNFRSTEALLTPLEWLLVAATCAIVGMMIFMLMLTNQISAQDPMPAVIVMLINTVAGAMGIAAVFAAVMSLRAKYLKR